ncbi:MAG: ABC transporter permease [Rhizobiaceae bacterium]|nr:ABC transporter permease [Rhizobiaceae bacterium]
MNRFTWIVLSCIFAISLWQTLVSATGVPHFILPSPKQVLDTLIKSRELIAWHALITISEVLIGLLLGAALGALTALHLMVSKTSRKLLMPILVFSQAIPVFALAPVLTLWLGYGIWSKVFMAVLITYFPVASNFLDGLRRTDRGFLDLASTMRAGKWQTLLQIRLPAALPSLASGLKLASVYAPIGAIIGEWVGASDGLGYLMLLANGRAKIDLMFASLFVLATFTVILHSVISIFANWLTRRAKGETKEVLENA